MGSEAVGPAQPVSLLNSDLSALALHQTRDQGDNEEGGYHSDHLWAPVVCSSLGPADQW